jgi:hypothetical protein
MALNDDDITTTPPGPGPEGPADGGAVPAAHDGGADGGATMDEGPNDGGANARATDGGADGGAGE